MTRMLHQHRILLLLFWYVYQRVRNIRFRLTDAVIYAKYRLYNKNSFWPRLQKSVLFSDGNKLAVRNESLMRIIYTKFGWFLGNASVHKTPEVRDLVRHPLGMFSKVGFFTNYRAAIESIVYLSFWELKTFGNSLIPLLKLGMRLNLNNKVALLKSLRTQ